MGGHQKKEQGNGIWLDGLSLGDEFTWRCEDRPRGMHQQGTKTPRRVSGLAMAAYLDPGVNPPPAMRPRQQGQFTTVRRDER
jgi:hypothetical protein